MSAYVWAISPYVTILLITIARLLCRRLKFEPITAGGQFWKALKELLPLAAFPILFFVFIIPSSTFHISSSESTAIAKATVIPGEIFISLWSMTSGATLITHIFLVKCFKKKVNEWENKQRVTYTESMQSM